MQLLQLQKQVILEYKPKAEYVDEILKSTNTLTVTQIAKDYGLTAFKLNKILNEKEIQYKVGGQWVLFDKYARLGYTKSDPVTIIRTDGRKDYKPNTKWTQKGRLFIHNLLKDMGILANMDKEV